MQIEVPYGREKQSCNVPESVQCVYGKLRQVEPELDTSLQIRLAIENLIGGATLASMNTFPVEGMALILGIDRFMERSASLNQYDRKYGCNHCCR